MLILTALFSFFQADETYHFETWRLFASLDFGKLKVGAEVTLDCSWLQYLYWLGGATYPPTHQPTIAHPVWKAELQKVAPKPPCTYSIV